MMGRPLSLFQEMLGLGFPCTRARNTALSPAVGTGYMFRLCLLPAPCLLPGFLPQPRQERNHWPGSDSVYVLGTAVEVVVSGTVGKKGEHPGIWGHTGWGRGRDAPSGAVTGQGFSTNSGTLSPAGMLELRVTKLKNSTVLEDFLVVTSSVAADKKSEWAPGRARLRTGGLAFS